MGEEQIKERERERKIWKVKRESEEKEMEEVENGRKTFAVSFVNVNDVTSGKLEMEGIASAEKHLLYYYIIILFFFIIIIIIIINKLLI